MKSLCLLRHAKSSWSQPELSDHERGLNKRGLKDAPRMGRHLASMGFRPDLILSSTAVRARSTTRLAAEAMRVPTSVCQFSDDLYLARPGDIIAAIQGTDAAVQTLMLCGHNPTFTDVVEILTGAPFAHLPTSAAVILNLNVATWLEVEPGCATLLHFETPRNLNDDS